MYVIRMRPPNPRTPWRTHTILRPRCDGAIVAQKMIGTYQKLRAQPVQQHLVRQQNMHPFPHSSYSHSDLLTRSDANWGKYAG